MGWRDFTEGLGGECGSGLLGWQLSVSGVGVTTVKTPAGRGGVDQVELSSARALTCF